MLAEQLLEAALVILRLLLARPVKLPKGFLKTCVPAEKVKVRFGFSRFRYQNLGSGSGLSLAPDFRAYMPSPT